MTTTRFDQPFTSATPCHAQAPAPRRVSATLLTALGGIAAALWLAAAPMNAQAAGCRQGWFGASAVEAAGPAVAQPRAPGHFTAVAIEGGFKVQLHQAGQEAVLVRAAGNLQALIETRVEMQKGEPTLLIKAKPHSGWCADESVEISVSLPQLRALSTAGAGEVKGDAFESERLAINVAGSGNVRLGQVKVQDIALNVAGSGDVAVASGQAARMKVSIAGSGDVLTSGLMADDVVVNIVGSGSADVHAAKNLATNIVGSGDVRYDGAAQLRNSSLGSGTVKHR